MVNKLLFSLLLVSTFAAAQQVPRTIIKGIVVSDSLEVENISIDNLSSKKLSMTDGQGSFMLEVQEKDTLVFSGVAFKSSVLIISKTHLEEDLLRIRLSVKVTEMDELIVRPYTLSGNLETDTKNLKVKELALNFEAIDFSGIEPKFNKTENAMKSIMPGSGNDFNGINFAALGRLLVKPKPKPKKIEFVTEKIFAVAVKEKFSSQFFSQTLKLKSEEVDLFLAFCDASVTLSQELLHPRKEFELIDFLLKKSEEYHKKN